MNKASKKHHYLPRHYLRGFVNEEGLFYIYDKLNDRILPDPLPPDSSFFENNLNTVSFPNGKSSDVLEDLYSKIERLSWGPLDIIRRSNYQTTIEPIDGMHLFLFISFLYWRLPCNIGYVDALSKKFFDKDDKNFDFVKIVGKKGDLLPEDINKILKESDFFRKSSRLLLPFAPLYKSNWNEKLINNWRFLYSGDKQNWYMVGDNPILTIGETDHDPVNCLNEFIFPVSGDIMLVNTNKPVADDMPPEWIIRCNIGLIEKADRFIACPCRDFLSISVEFYKIYVQNNRKHLIHQRILEMI